MIITFDENAESDERIKQIVASFVEEVPTLETKHQMPILIFQDGVKGAYYIKCSLLATHAARLCNLNAKLVANNPESLRANRELMLSKSTYLKMKADAAIGREFNDIIVEYITDYDPDTPLKVWGGQHRISAISAASDSDRYHGFRVYFNLSKEQRQDLALISNTNIAVSKDTFDRMVEETEFGNRLRRWCRIVGLLEEEEDFPDAGTRSESITVKRARSFVVNFYLGRDRGEQFASDELDRNVHQPYLASTGVVIDQEYARIMAENDILCDEHLIMAGKNFATLHKVQYKTVRSQESGIANRKPYRNKALVESVLCGWSFVAGLLQSHPDRLDKHYSLPNPSKKVPDPLNAQEMSEFKYDSDPPTYRGLGTRSSAKDRQRIAQLFLARSLNPKPVIDKKLMHGAVSQVEWITRRTQGYA